MLIFILIGAVAGIVMGSVGVGGGAIIIFCLSAFAKFPQKMAQGTTLLIVAAPVSLLAALHYHKQGHVDIKAAITIIISFIIFSFLGSHIAIHLPNSVLKIFLGVILCCMGAKLIFSGWGALN